MGQASPTSAASPKTLQRQNPMNNPIGTNPVGTGGRLERSNSMNINPMGNPARPSLKVETVQESSPLSSPSSTLSPKEKDTISPKEKDKTILANKYDIFKNDEMKVFGANQSKKKSAVKHRPPPLALPEPTKEEVKELYSPRTRSCSNANDGTVYYMFNCHIYFKSPMHCR